MQLVGLIGKYISFGQTSCLACAQGRFTQTAGAAWCDACPRGDSEYAYADMQYAPRHTSASISHLAQTTNHAHIDAVLSKHRIPTHHNTHGRSQTTRTLSSANKHLLTAWLLTDCTRAYSDCMPADVDCTPADADCTPADAACTPVDADCTSGKYQPGYQATHCDDCAAGLFNPSPASSTCTQCAAGWFTAAASSKHCDSCTPGLSNLHVSH